MGAFALIPFLGAGFIGLPIGIHFGRKFGIGIIFPLTITDWWIGLLAGILFFVVSIFLGGMFSDED